MSLDEKVNMFSSSENFIYVRALNIRTYTKEIEIERDVNSFSKFSLFLPITA